MNRKRFSGLALVAAAASLVAMTQSSCSVVVNDFKEQCNTTQDCIDLANRQPKLADGTPSVKGLVCSDKHVCEPESGCHTNTECQDAHGGEPYICRSRDRTCQALRLTVQDNEDKTVTLCDVLADTADFRNENTIYVGASVLFKDDSNQGLEIVRRDFKLASGLPPATATSKERRPLAFVYCEAADDEDKGLTEVLHKGADHLINDLDLPVVITSLGTSDEIDVLQNYSLAHDPPVFQLSTSAGGALLKTKDNQGQLVDLVLINENYAQETVELVANYYTPLLQQKGGPLATGDKPRVAVIHSGTPTAANTGNKIVTELESSGTVDPGDALELGYGTADDPAGNPAVYASIVSQVIKFKPHAIIILGDEEIAGIDGAIEERWASEITNQPAPQWLGILGSVGQLSEDIKATPLPARLDWGSRALFIQQHYDFNSSDFKKYINQLKQVVGQEDPDGIVSLEYTSPFNEFLREGGYLTAYSIALLAAQGEPVTGPNVAQAARSFGDANSASFTVGPDDVFPALQSLASTKMPFLLNNFQGWVGFDENGFARYNFADDVACLTPATSEDDPPEATVGALQATGGIFETSGKLTGTVSLTGCVSP